MKKCLLVALFALFYLFSIAQVVEYKGLCYMLDTSKNTATVVSNGSYSGFESGYEYACEFAQSTYSGDITIPEDIVVSGQKYSVSGIDGIYLGGDDSGRSEGAFSKTPITSITIPKTIKWIGRGAFLNCNSLSAVYISDLSAWCNIDFQEYYDEYWEISIEGSNPLQYAHNLYLNGEKVEELHIPNNVYYINDRAFVGCNLSDVYTLHDNINQNAFSKKAKGITFHIRERFKDNFKWATKIEYIEGVDFRLIYKVDDKVYKEVFYKPGESIKPISGPEKRGYTFSGWSDLPKTMSDHDLTVSGTLRPNTYNLIYKVDGEEYKVLEVRYDETISPEPYPAGKGMTFSGWSEIPKTMPARDVEVTGTFSYSKSTIDNVTYQVTDTEKEFASVIGNDNATGEVVIASTVDFDATYKITAINDKAFNGCKDVTKIEIGSNVISIGERAFANIDKLTDVTILANEIPKTDRTAFENSYIEDYVTLHVPEGSLEKYKSTAPWKNFKEIVGIAAPKEPDKCATPTVTYKEGKLHFESETEGVTFHYEVTPSDAAKNGDGNDVEITGKYKITVYASKEGYIDSDETTTETTAAGGIRGDLNNDGKVDVKDHVELSNIIMNTQEVEAEVEPEEAE